MLCQRTATPVKPTTGRRVLPAARLLERRLWFWLVLDQTQTGSRARIINWTDRTPVRPQFVMFEFVVFQVCAGRCEDAAGLHRDSGGEAELGPQPSRRRRPPRSAGQSHDLTVDQYNVPSCCQETSTFVFLSRVDVFILSV